MRKKIVAGNWKMNKNLQEGVALAKELTEVVKNPNCGVIICTPFIHLASVAEIVKGSPIELGAENCADKASGAYTGEVSAEMVKFYRCRACHSRTLGAPRVLQRDSGHPQRESRSGIGKRPEGHLLHRRVARTA